MNDVAANELVNVMTPLPIVTAPNVRSRSPLIVTADEILEKSTSAPAAGTALPAQFPGVDILPSPASPVQRLPEAVPTMRNNWSPETLHAKVSSPVAGANFAPSAAVMPSAEQIA